MAIVIVVPSTHPRLSLSDNSPITYKANHIKINSYLREIQEAMMFANSNDAIMIASNHIYPTAAG